MSSGTLVTGAAGILGNALLDSGALADAVGTVHRRSSPHDSVVVDLCDAAAVDAVLRRVRPSVVVHTVALTDVDGSERDPGEAFAVSAGTTSNLARWLAREQPDTLLVYISTDQVYSGEGPHPEASTAPINAYGQAKRAGELAAAQAPRHLILRTNFFGHSEMRRSYTDYIVQTVRDGGSLRVDPRQSFSALHLRDLTSLVGEAVEARLVGVYNLGARDGIRKIDFARAVADLATVGGAALVMELADDPERAPRPLDLRLDVQRISAALGHDLPTVADGLAQMSEELRAS